MKIALVTDDGQTISSHFGRAQYYLVCTIEDGQITQRERRDKPGRRQFADEPHEAHRHEHGQHGHGFGHHADEKHRRMAEVITDCEALVARGMGQGAYQALEASGIKPILTDLTTIEDAVRAYIDGALANRIERLH